jgi:hypothetical protein
MAGADRMAIEEVVRKVLVDGHADVLRESVRWLAGQLMEVEVSELIGAERGERRPEDRATHRNGYRPRRWDTRAAVSDNRPTETSTSVGSGIREANASTPARNPPRLRMAGMRPWTSSRSSVVACSAWSIASFTSRAWASSPSRPRSPVRSRLRTARSHDLVAPPWARRTLWAWAESTTRRVPA